ncbi:MAG: hypothetical protein RBU29_08070 [bacterium]|nr:hypothetical protein [bacterium]
MPETTISIGGFDVDLQALFGIAHECRPIVCKQDCCCGCYEICADKNEVRQIVSLLPIASHFAPHLRDGDEWVDLFDPVEQGLCALETDDEGLCQLAYRSGEAMYCSLHSAALHLGLSPFTVKPKVCSLWPVAWVEGERPLLTIQDDAFDFPCNRPQDPRIAPLSPAIAETLQWAFGAEFYATLCQQARERWSRPDEL